MPSGCRCVVVWPVRLCTRSTEHRQRRKMPVRSLGPGLELPQLPCHSALSRAGTLPDIAAATRTPKCRRGPESPLSPKAPSGHSSCSMLDGRVVGDMDSSPKQEIPGHPRLRSLRFRLSFKTTLIGILKCDQSWRAERIGCGLHTREHDQPPCRHTAKYALDARPLMHIADEPISPAFGGSHCRPASAVAQHGQRASCQELPSTCHASSAQCTLRPHASPSASTAGRHSPAASRRSRNPPTTRPTSCRRTSRTSRRPPASSPRSSCAPRA
jgi:hypothetical protein